MRPLLLAHRGHRAAGPENSLSSVVSAFEVADGAEVDVIVTADGRACLRHDERLPDGTPLRALSLDEARGLSGADADALPEVAAVLSALATLPAARRGTLDLELKVPGAARALEPLRASFAATNVVLTSFYATEVLDALARFPDRPVGLLLDAHPARFLPEGVACLAVREAILPEVRAAFPQAPLWAWTVNDEAAAARARAARVAVVIGDDVATLRRWFPA